MAVTVQETDSEKKGTRVSLSLQGAGATGPCCHLDESTPATFVLLLPHCDQDSERERESDWLNLGHIHTLEEGQGTVQQDHL